MSNPWGGGHRSDGQIGSLARTRRDPDFVYPAGLEAGADEVLRGEYDIAALRFERPPTVLDLGANCGAFTFWARKRWPGCRCIMVEPHPVNAQLARANNPGVELIEAAALHDPRFEGDAPCTLPRVQLYDGVDGGAAGSGQASLECRGGQKRDDPFEVDAVRARDLPRADVVKCDIEGAERMVLQGYLEHYRLVEPAAVMLEFHRREDRFAIGALLQAHGLRWVSERVDAGGHSGILRFARQSFLGVCPECHREDGRRQGFRRADGRLECHECGEVFG